MSDVRDIRASVSTTKADNEDGKATITVDIAMSGGDKERRNVAALAAYDTITADDMHTSIAYSLQTLGYENPVH